MSNELCAAEGSGRKSEDSPALRKNIDFEVESTTFSAFDGSSADHMTILLDSIYRHEKLLNDMKATIISIKQIATSIKENERNRTNENSSVQTREEKNNEIERLTTANKQLTDVNESLKRKILVLEQKSEELESRQTDQSVYKISGMIQTQLLHQYEVEKYEAFVMQSLQRVIDSLRKESTKTNSQIEKCQNKMDNCQGKHSERKIQLEALESDNDNTSDQMAPSITRLYREMCGLVKTVKFRPKMGAPPGILALLQTVKLRPPGERRRPDETAAAEPRVDTTLTLLRTVKLRPPGERPSTGAKKPDQTAPSAPPQSPSPSQSSPPPPPPTQPLPPDTLAPFKTVKLRPPGERPSTGAKIPDQTAPSAPPQSSSPPPSPSQSSPPPPPPPPPTQPLPPDSLAPFRTVKLRPPGERRSACAKKPDQTSPRQSSPSPTERRPPGTKNVESLRIRPVEKKSPTEVYCNSVHASFSRARHHRIGY